MVSFYSEQNQYFYWRFSSKIVKILNKQMPICKYTNSSLNMQIYEFSSSY